MSQASAFPEAKILVVHDDSAEAATLTRLLAQAGYSQVMSTTDAALVLGICEENAPDLVLLDLHTARLSGFEVLAQLRPLIEASPALPVLVIGADAAGEQALAAGARGFISEPFSGRDVCLRVSNLLAARKAQLELSEQVQALELRLAERAAEAEHLKQEVIGRLTLLLEYRRDETREHAERVGRTGAAIAQALGLSPESVEIIRRAAPLHDAGKLGISDSILLKARRLTPDERAMVNSHTTIGYEMLADSSSELLRIAAQIALSHHERWDGSGYPQGLAGNAIPLVGRIAAVADAFDTLTHDRPYKDALSVPDAVAEIARCSESQFDPEVVEAFLTLDHEALLDPIAPSPARGGAGEAVPALLGSA
jgi:putative two-component system response regulator